VLRESARDVSEGLLGDDLAGRGAVVAQAEDEPAGAVLVEDGSGGDDGLLELGRGALEFDGLGFFLAYGGLYRLIWSLSERRYNSCRLNVIKNRF
jgi:hypothetical protein